MVYAGILAGGVGSRIGESIPKQFLLINDKPIIIYTIEMFLEVKEIDYIVVAVLQDYIDYTKDLISKYLDTDRIYVIEGGKNRSDSLLNVCKFIGEDSSNILVSHDACRPFVSERIIEDNIKSISNCDFVGTFIPAVDTLAVIHDNNLIDIPKRDNLFSVQTPQTFRIKDYVDCYKRLSISDRELLTDASKVFLLNKKRINIVNGDSSNIKITNPVDLEYASAMLDSSQKVLYKDNKHKQ